MPCDCRAPVMVHDDGPLLALVVPEPQRVVVAAGREPLTIGAVRKAGDRAIVAGQLLGKPQFLRGDIPDADRLGQGGRGEPISWLLRAE